MGSPKIPTPQAPPPPPTPAALVPPKNQNSPTLGGTFLTQGQPEGSVQVKPRKTLLGQ